MAQKNNPVVALWSCAAVVLAFAGREARADDPSDMQQQLRQLQQQNSALQEQMIKQQALIEELSRKMAAVESTNADRGREMDDLKAGLKDAAPETKPSKGFRFENVKLWGEGSVGFFVTGSDGMYPNSTFRVDEARLFLEAPIYDQVYFFGQLDLMTPEDSDLNVQLGELYLDFESVSRLWGSKEMLSIRAGRMYVPFGEEYLRRYAIDNPFITRSITDIWGVDEGIELYGSAGKFSYIAAVQNGGVSGTQDFDGDKAVTARLGYDPTSWLHLSASAMRTGNLDANQDVLSEVWFGGGWFRSLGSAATTKFHANMVEGDVEVRLGHGYLRAFGGYIKYDDNDPTQNNQRNVYYYTVQGVHDIWGSLYGGVSFGQILAENGFPIVGYGNMNEYLFGPLTDELWRLSLCVGYRFSPNLVVKAEYSFEKGREAGGQKRDHENLFAVGAAFRF